MAEDPETYLRLAAETAIRQARGDEGARTAFHAVALAFAETGVLAPNRADEIVATFEAAAAVRAGSDDPASLFSHVERRSDAWLSRAGYWTGPHPLPSPFWARPATGNLDPVTAAGVSTLISYQCDEANVDFYLFAVYRSAGTAWLIAAAHTTWRKPRQGRGGFHAFPRLDDLKVTDDAGRSYTFRFTGGGTDTWWTGKLQFSPDLPRDVAWLDVRVLDEAPTRMELGTLTALRTATARGTATSLQPRIATRRIGLNRVDRYVQVSAEHSLLARPVSDELRALAAVVRALLAVGAFRSDSALPGQVAQLCERAGWPGHGIDTERPAALPLRWQSYLDAASFGDARYHAHHGSHPPPSVASIPIALPEINGAQIALAALVNRGEMTELYGSFRSRYGVNSLASCWLHDDAGQWHIAMPGDWSSDGQVCDMTRLLVFPPVPRTARSVEIVTTGEAVEVRISVPLAWLAP